MSSQGPRYPTSFVNTTNTGNTWTESTFLGFVKSNVQFDDSKYARWHHSGAAAAGDYLDITGFGFNLPATATITGLEVLIKRYPNTTDGGGNLYQLRDHTVQLIKGGTAQGDNKFVNSTMSATEEVVYYGSSSDLWGLTFTYSDINASNFGVRYSAQHLLNTDTDTVSVYVNQITIIVYHTISGVDGVTYVSIDDIVSAGNREIYLEPVAASTVEDVVSSSDNEAMIDTEIVPGGNGNYVYIG